MCWNRRTATYSAKRNDGKPNLWRLDYRSDGGWRDDGLHDYYPAFPLRFGGRKPETHVQDIINDIMPCLLPLIKLHTCVLAVGEKVKPLTVIGGIALVGNLRFTDGVILKRIHNVTNHADL